MRCHVFPKWCPKTHNCDLIKCATLEHARQQEVIYLQQAANLVFPFFLRWYPAIRQFSKPNKTRLYRTERYTEKEHPPLFPHLPLQHHQSYFLWIVGPALKAPLMSLLKPGWSGPGVPDPRERLLLRSRILLPNVRVEPFSLSS
jgi:hypothetical protein